MTTAPAGIKSKTIEKGSRDKEAPYNVLLVVRWPVGGIRTFLRYVYTCLDPARYRFTILAPDLPELEVLLKDLEVLDISPVRLSDNPAASELARAVFNTLRQGKLDLIHSHGLTAGLCSILPSLVTRVPHLLTVHDVFTDRQFEGVTGVAKKAAFSTLLPWVNTIHAVSRDAKDNLLQYVPALKPFRRKIVPILNGVEVERFSNAEVRDLRKEFGLPDNTFLIGFLGRFMSPKGFIYLAEALEIMLRQSDGNREPMVLTFGEGGFMREEQAYVRDKRLEQNIRFLPYTPNVASTLRGLDVLAMPSLWEACGLLAMEALVAGVPLIGANCIGLREVLEDTPAVMVPTRDGPALAAALLEEMANPSRAGAEAFRDKAAARYDVRIQAQAIEQLMLNLMR